MTTDGGQGAGAAVVAAGEGAGAAAAAGGGDYTWLGSDAKPEITQYVQSKGFKSAAALAEGYINAEKALSSREFTVPKHDDQANWAKIKAAMGVPETADKYDTTTLKGVSAEALKPWLAKMHAAGIPQAAAVDLLGSVMTQAQAAKEAEHVKFVQTSEAEMEKVKAKWGQEFDKNTDLARRGIAKLGEQLGGQFTSEQLGALEKALGTERMLNMGLILGRHMVEAGFVMSDGQHRNMTKESAQARRNTIQSDPKLNDALFNSNNPAHASIKREWAELGNVING